MSALPPLPTLEELIVAFDKGLRTGFAPAQSLRPVPGEELPEAEMTGEPRAHAAALVRGAQEETEPLAWTERRIGELGGRKSLLNPAFYAGSFAMGALAGLLGDRWNLGFLAETERQVVKHLEGHLQTLAGAAGTAR